MHFLGGGKNKERWIKLAQKYSIKDKVFFDGVLPSGRPVMKWLDNVDILLMISKTEGLPRILIEAMSRGCPVVGSNVGGIPELLNEDCLVKPNDYKKLSAMLEDILSNSRKIKNMANLNYIKSFKFEKNILRKKREKFFTEILEEN